MAPVTRLPWRRPMSGRDPDESHRASTPLELFFDLCFVVAVAAAAATLHHDVAEGHLDGLIGYAMVFFAIWWAWLGYSWFASAYDTDDVQFRLATFLVMAGVLVLAAGVPRASEEQDYWLVVVGYVIMRLALVPQWFRVARDHPAARRTAHRFIAYILVVQVLWVLRTWLFDEGAANLVSFAALVMLELAGPWWAESVDEGTPWHRHHIAERYELFTIIVLGEVILASTDAISSSLDGHGLGPGLLALVGGGLLLVFSMWWIYFKAAMVDSLRPETSFAFGYGHYVVFASAAAVGAALAVQVEVVEHLAHVSRGTADLVLAGAVSAYLLSVGALHALGSGAASLVPAAVTVVVLIVIALVGFPAGVGALLMGLVVALSLTAFLWRLAAAEERAVSA